MIETVNQGYSKNNSPYTIRDTLLFDVQRSIKGAERNWTIAYQILNTYPYGTFKTEKAICNPVFAVDRQGGEKVISTPPTTWSVLDRTICKFFQESLIPFPAEDLRPGYTWKGNMRGETLDFVVSQDEPVKFGRPCFHVYFTSGSPRLQGHLYFEKTSGQLVYCEWGDEYFACRNCSGQQFRFRMALREQSNMLAESIQLFQAGAAEVDRLYRAQTWLVPPIYTSIRPLSEDKDHRGYIVEQGGVYGLLDEHGAMVLAPEYNQIEPGSGQIVQVKKARRNFLVNPLGQVLIDSLDELGNHCYFRDTCQVVRKKGLWIGVSEKGKIMYTSNKEKYPTPKEEKTIVQQGEKLGLVQEDRVIIPVEFSFLRGVGNNLVSAHKDSMAYLFDGDGHLLWRWQGNGAITSICGDIAVIGRKGLFNWKTHQLLYAGNYDLYASIDYCDQQFFIIDHPEETGKLLFNASGQLLGEFKTLYAKKGESAIIASDTLDQVGFINFQGAWMIKLQYQAIYPDLHDGVFVAKMGFDTVGLLRMDGTVLLPFMYHRIQFLGQGKYYTEGWRFEKLPYLTTNWAEPFHPYWLRDLPAEYGYQRVNIYEIYDVLTGKRFPLPEGVKVQYPVSYEKEIFLRVEKEEKTGLLDLDLAEVVPIAFKNVGPVTRFGVVVEVQGKTGVIKRP